MTWEETPTAGDFIPVRLALPSGELRLLQPRQGVELPDDGPVEWAPLAPYWAVLWRSGMALARELADAPLRGRRVVELGCGLGVPSLVAAAAGATVLTTDEDPEALALLEGNASKNGLAVDTMRVEWSAAEALVARGPFDLVLAADVLYERGAVAPLLSLLPRLARQAWLADPGRPVAGAFFDQARRVWSATTTVRDGVEIHRLTTTAR